MQNNEILEKIKEKIESEDAKALQKIGINSAFCIGEILSPINTMFAKIGKEIAEQSDILRLNHMLNGYMKGNNTEMRLNQLYTFVKNSDRAFLVSNLFRQALLKNSTIVCCLYGLILAECVDNDKKADYEDLIVLNALQNATDYELKYFIEIIDNYMDEGYVDTKAISESGKEVEYNFTLEWCKNNRILGITGRRDYGEGMTIFTEYLIYISCTEKLYNLLMEAKQLMRYEWE